MIQIIPLTNFPIIKKGDNIGEIILDSYKKNNLKIQNKDILVIAQSIVSRAEGAIINLDSIEPSHFAIEIAKQSNKDPKHVEAILRASKNICKFRNNILITETKHGFVCANSGLDKSNVPGEHNVSLLPENPDKSAKKIRETIEKKTKQRIAILISDTHGRPFRMGAINIAIGCSGIEPLLSYIGKIDLFNYQLKTSIVAIADQLCSAAGLQMGEADEGLPVILIRGVEFKRKEGSATKLIRPVEKDYFR